MDVVEDGVDDEGAGKCRAALCCARPPDANIDVTRHMSGVTPLSLPAPSLLSSFSCDTPNARSCPKHSPSTPLLLLQVFNPILYPNRTICPIGPQILAEIPRDLSWMTHQVQEDGALPSASVIRVRSRTLQRVRSPPQGLSWKQGYVLVRLIDPSPWNHSRHHLYRRVRLHWQLPRYWRQGRPCRVI